MSDMHWRLLALAMEPTHDHVNIDSVATSDEHCCSAQHGPTAMGCTRAVGHPSPHVAEAGNGQYVAVWKVRRLRGKKKLLKNTTEALNAWKVNH